MFKKNLKRCLAVLLTVMMLVTSLPTGVFATELESTVTETEHDHEHDHVNEDAVEFIEGSLTEDEELTTQVPEVTDTVTDAALGESESEEEIVTDTDTESAITDSASSVTDENVTDENVTDENVTDEDVTDEDITVDDTITDEAVNATVTVLDGKITISDSVDKATVSSDIVTITATGSYISTQKNNITISNSSGKNATVTFKYVISGVGTGDSASFNGTSLKNGEYAFSGVINAESSISASISAWGSGTTKIVLSDFTYTEVKENASVTFEYDSTLGSVTAADVAVNSGSSVDISNSNGAVLVATPASGITFYGWVDSTNKILSTSASFTLYPTDDMTVKPVFGKDGDSGVYMVGTAQSSTYKIADGLGGLLATTYTYYNINGTHIFDDFNEATTFAASSTSKYVALMNSVTLSAGTYTVPSGVTLLVPFDSANTLYTTTPVPVAPNSNNSITVNEYRTLTLADGANIVINGAMSLSAKHCYSAGSKQNGGSPTGDVSFIRMQGSSNITVNSGGTLYAYGYITGSGSVTANRGSKVYEMFQIMDFRGGTQSTDMDNSVFPLSQYYVQNIEVPLTLYAGATEYSYTTIFMSSSAFGSSVAFIGESSGMFQLTEGYVTKRYDGTTDRLMVESHGKLKVSPINMSVGTSSINSKDYVLGINGNITVDVKSGSIALNQNIAFLPGSEIIVGEGVTCTLGNGNKVYVYDVDQWSNYCGPLDAKFIPINYAPGKVYTRTEADLKDAKLVVNGTVDASAGFLYTTAGGAAITGTEGAKVTITSGTDTVTYQLRQKTSTYDEIPITSAKLMNADGTYTETLNSTDLQYTYENGVWAAHCEHLKENEKPIADEIPATCTQSGMTAGLKCGNCGKILTEQEVIPATGHKIVIDAAVAPTCTATGLTAGQHCENENCDDASVNIAQNTIEALGHSWSEYTVVTEATCTTSGSKTRTCTVESCGVTEKENIDALGHDYDYEGGIVVTAPTCTAQGYTTKTCRRDGCNLVTVEDYVNPIAHEIIVDAEIPATCLAEGREAGQHCANCDTQTIVGDVIPMLDHSYTNEDTSKRIEATCTEAGSTVMYCVNGCDTFETVTIPKHNTETMPQKDATCGEAGYTSYVWCNDCQKVVSGKEEIPATGEHTLVTVTGTPATCTEAGKTDGEKCSVCGYVSKEQVEIPATNHANAETIQGYPATCTEAGLTDDIYCYDCNTAIQEAEVIPALGHDFEGKGTVVTAPTCDKEGYTTYTCQRKGCTYSEVKDEQPALGHDWKNEVTKAATCTETGILTKTCQRADCGAVITETIPALDHDYNETVTAPTCEADGYTTYTCQRENCGDSYIVTDEGSALGHDWNAGEESLAPTCQSEGKMTYTCQRDNCGATKVEPIAVVDHKYAEEGVVETAPTCETTGEKRYYCVYNCGAYKSETLDALTHDYSGEGTVVTAPTCVADGYTTYTCQRENCGDSYKVTDEGSALGHDWNAGEESLAPTCKSEGEMTYTCQRDNCGATKVEPIAVVDHKYAEEGVVETAPTCETTGEKRYYCVYDCGAYETETLDALDHDYKATVTEATCEADKFTTYECQRENCDNSYIVTEEGSALGHDYDEGVETTAPTCTTPGVLTKSCKRDGCDSKITEAIKALDHDYSGEGTVVTAPTCEADGYTTYTCQRENCGYSYKVTNEGSALGHDWNAGEESLAPTCKSEGEMTYTCQRDNCGATKVEPIAVVDHKYAEEGVIETEPTCETAGEKKYYCVYDCGAYETETLDALDHDYKATVTEATCEADKFTTYECQREECDNSYIVTEEGTALGHDYDEGVETTAPTCTTPGVLTKSCKRDGCDSEITEAIKALEHEYTSKVTKEATCTETGIEVFTCARGDDEYEVELTALGHDLIHEELRAATCTEAGEKASSHCSRCDYIEGGGEIAPLGHDYVNGTTVIPPTCTSKGYTLYECQRDGCGESHKDDEVAMLDHELEFTEYKQEPTCVVNGIAVYSCKNCDYTEEVVATAPGHDFDDGVVTLPDCENKGYTTYTCSVCSYFYIDNEVDKLGHSYDAAVKAPTCTEDGYTTYTCSVCSDTYTDDIVGKLGHSYDAVVKAPTCTEDGYTTYTCSVCGDTYTDDIVGKLGHSYDAAVTAPTCTADGYTTYTCSVCGDTYTDDIVGKLGHSYDTAVTAPTCTEDGYTTYTCSACGDTYKADEVDALGHDIVIDEAVEPTCTETGLTAGQHCSRCDAMTVAQEIVDELGHDYDDGVITVEPKCTEAGKKVITCKRGCGDHYTETVPAKGHSYDAVVTAPDCENKGYTTYTCSVCGDTYTDDVVDALGHSYDAVVTAPTCTEDGYTTYTCSVCGDTYTDDVVDALGHSYDAVVTAPTCTEDGYTTYTCSVCGDTYTDDVVDALGHSYDAVVTAPTCEAKGFTTYTCSACGDTYTADEVDELGHNYVGEVTKEPACEEAGVRTYTCANGCGKYYTEAISATGHSYETVVTAPTCEDKGFTTYTCSVCSDTYDTDYVDAIGHSYVAVVTAPTCTTRGYTTHTCSNCEDSYQDSYVAALRHDIITDAAVAPTCTETGLTAGRHCSRCDAMTVAQEIVDALGHDIVKDAAKAPTCTETGLTEGQHCSRCDAMTVAQDVVDVLGHDIVIDAAVAPTCLETGLTEGQHCSRCDAMTVAQNVVDALGHNEEILAAVAPTCEATGLTEGKKCTVCGVVTVKQTTVAALGHTYVKDEYKAPTCLETGLSEGNHCDRCGKVHVAQIEIAALGHDKVTDKAIEATCLDTGLTEGWHCSRCDAKEEQVEVAALGHDYEVVIIAPTCVKDGYNTNTCKRCGDFFTSDFVTKLGHTEVIDAKVDATCLETGLTEGSHCSVCGYVIKTQVAIPAKGHTEVVDAKVEPTCTETGLTEGSHCSVCGEVILAQEEIPAKGHDIQQYAAQLPTYTDIGWDAFEACSRCDYTTKVEIPALGEPSITDFDSFLENLILLEEFAKEFARANPGNDPLMLVIKYIRTGVDRYNSGSWGIMAGYENADFAKYVTEAEAAYNKNAASIDDYLKVTGLKNIEYFTLPNGDYVDFGHMFGTMDITYHNKGSENHADVAGWAGDLVDLMSATDRHNVDGTVEEMVAEISEKYLCSKDLNEADIFSEKDMLGDLDGYFVMNELYKSDYESGDMYELFKSYFTASLTIEDRAAYFLENRLGGSGTKTATREAVYEAYTANKVVSTLEGTREFIRDDLTDLRTACCYSFADFLCKLAGDYVESVDNKFYTVFSTEKSTLAPGITQEKHKAYTADDKQIVYYVATADINSEYVHVYANYKDNDPTSWGMARVLDQANAAQAKYGDPASPHYIENYNVITSINGDGYNMTTGEPGGLLVMGGVEYHPVDGGGFFAITKDGKAVIGTKAQYDAMKDDIAEAVGGFGTTLIKDGKISITASSNYYVNRASRTSVGITKTGKVVFMVLDGRQEPVSCGGSMEEIAQIMLDAGCVHAINLDGGGSSTYVAREEGATELAVVSVPSDGYARSVSTSLMMVSTAPSSTEFHHAVVDADKSYLTIGSTTQLTASGVSAMGNSTDIPEGATWAVSDEALGTVSADGIFTAKANGTVEVYLMLDGNVVGEKKLNIVVPDTVYFKKDNIDAVYGETFKLPVIALYEGKEVAINENDITMIPANPAACVIEGFNFTGIEESGVKNVIVTAVLNADESVKGEVTVSLYNQGEATFDFDQAIGGNRQFAWDRQVSNSTTDDNVVYNVINPAEDMVTSYIFAIDMTQIPIPEQLADLTTMLPGADAEDACAWNFLLQLAERISVLTTVKPQVVFDKNFDVDYSDLTIVNEYFELNGTEFDEETNTLTLTLNWIDQTQAIDPTMANPICILSGIKLTPKDTAAWDAKDRLNPVNSGNISYDIYMRASALYSFAQKPENQEVYGVYPFVNPNDESEKGGHFGSVYCQFTDTYTLVKSLKNGWVMEDGGYAYYVSGEKTYGVALIDGLYYDFGTNGINSGKTPYTGIFDVDGVNYYAKFGKLASGWAVIDNQKYCFDENGKGLDGKEVVDEVEYEFDNGLLVGGYTGIVKKSNGRSYYYIDGEIQFNWHKIGEYWYHFHDEDGWMTTGYHQYPDDKTTFYDFADDGRLLYGSFRSSGYYYWAGQPLQDSWVQISAEPDDWYRTNGSGHFVTDLTSNPTVRILIDGVIYTFDNTNGKLIKGNFITEGSNIYYYWAGKPLTSGWFEHDGDTYYAFSDGHLATGEQTIDGKNYKFNDKGALIKEENVKTVPMYRMYNPNSGEHFYTGSTEERDILVKAGWNYEGVAFNFPVVGKPVYRLYEPITGEHLYTMDEAEKAKLLAEGWNYEGVAFNSAGEDEVPQYRLHNPNATCGAYHFTGSTEERDILIKAGWEYQGIGWYSCVK